MYNEADLKDYIVFKMKQATRLHNIDSKDPKAKEKLKEIARKNKDQWIKEFIAASTAA